MTNDLTADGLTFKLVYSDANGSLRRETSRGVNLPTELRVAHTPYVDSKTKKSGNRSVARLDYSVEMSDASVGIVSLYTVAAVPSDPNVTSTIINGMVTTLRKILHAADTGLDLSDEIFVNREQ